MIGGRWSELIIIKVGEVFYIIPGYCHHHRRMVIELIKFRSISDGELITVAMMVLMSRSWNHNVRKLAGRETHRTESFQAAR